MFRTGDEISKRASLSKRGDILNEGRFWSSIKRVLYTILSSSISEYKPTRLADKFFLSLSWINK
jgi:hypothetical protein